MHNAHVYFLIHVSLGTINSLTCILDCMAGVAQDLLSAPASDAYVVEHVFSVCGELAAGKKNRQTKSLAKRIMMKMNLKYYE